MAKLIQQSTANDPLFFFLTATSDHITGLTGASPTVTISKNGAAFATPSGAVSQIANGWYQVAGNATDTGTLGDILLHATATSADPCDIVAAQVVAFNPRDANLSLSNVSANVTEIAGAALASHASGAMPADLVDIAGTALSTHAAGMVPADVRDIAGSAVSTTTAQLGVNVVSVNSVAASSVTTINANQGTTQPVNFTGTAASALVKSDMQDIAGSAVSTSSAQIGVNVVDWGATAVGAVPPDAMFIRSGTAQAGGATSITLDAGASATNNIYDNAVIFIRSGTGANQVNIIASYVGATKVATVQNTWPINPDLTSVFTILSVGPAQVGGAVGSVTGAVGSVTGNVGGNIVGSVASVTGAVGSVTGNVGGNVVGSVASVTGAVASVTGNVGGNVAGSVASVTGSVGSVTASVTVGTNNDKTGYALTAGERTSVADALLDRDMSLGTDSGSSTVRTTRQALRSLRNKITLATGAVTVFKEDDLTSSWTAAATTDPTAEPIVTLDPA